MSHHRYYTWLGVCSTKRNPLFTWYINMFTAYHVLEEDSLRLIGIRLCYPAHFSQEVAFTYLTSTVRHTDSVTLVLCWLMCFTSCCQGRTRKEKLMLSSKMRRKCHLQLSFWWNEASCIPEYVNHSYIIKKSSMNTYLKCTLLRNFDIIHPVISTLVRNA